MTDDRSTVDGTLEGFSVGSLRRRDVASLPALAVAWSREEPHRVGEIALIDTEQMLGRGSSRAEDTLPRIRLSRQRPTGTTMMGPIGSVRISRAQLRLRPRGDDIEVESVGQCPLLINGEPAERGVVGPGDTLHLKNELLLLVTRRPERMPALRSFSVTMGGEQPAHDFPFGAADPFGLVGETPALWALRDIIAFAAIAEGHVLVRGPSGSGKELADGAIHRLSTRGARPLVARNAATFPPGLVDAELFGNVKNYPNPGTAEREGLVGEADGTSLFLDEIGELPAEMQAHLLRVLDRRGEYQRLGESRVRRADLRVIAATNRAIDELKHDFAARFPLRIEVPPLAERREDIPLLVRHLLRRAAEENDEVRRSFFEARGGGEPEARVAPDLIERLLRHPLRANTRDLKQILWQALAESRGKVVELTPGVDRRLASAVEESAVTAPVDVGREQIEAALARARGNVTKAAEELGLKNRFVLYRLMKKLGVDGPPEHR